MRHKDYGAAAFPQFRDAVETLCLKRNITNGKNLVEQHDVGIQMGRDREAQANIHSRRIALHWNVNVFLYS